MNQSEIYQESTHDVVVAVSPEYLPDHSDPDEGRFVWAYHVRIENHGATAVQLLYRHWRIADGIGGAHDVVGDGVVGEQPVLEPGDSYTYSSGTPLATASGFMSGRFNMIRADGLRFDVEVPAFSLDGFDRPSSVH
jgi:ApaG protein